MTYAAQHIMTAMDDTKERGDLLTTLGIFGNMRYPVLNALDLIGREHMRESPFYQEILAEGRAEGELRTRRTAVLEALETRFGAGVVAEFRDVLDTITDAPRPGAPLGEFAGRISRGCRSMKTSASF